ncbi:MAG: hypothetical protein JW862_17175 [Anaerolineales bacterium]|nr:hypothetical protein [Anaerolineales bacterium]
MTRWFFLFSLVVGLLAQAFGYAQAGNLAGAIALPAIGLCWLLAQWRRWRWFASLYLGLMLLVAAAGVLVWEVAFGWNFAGLLGALLAWDLEAFSRRLALAAEDDDRASLERSHLTRLSGFGLLAILLAGVTRLVALEVSFGWSFWLVVLLAMAFTRVVLWLRRKGNA